MTIYSIGVLHPIIAVCVYNITKHLGIGRVFSGFQSCLQCCSSWLRQPICHAFYYYYYCKSLEVSDRCLTGKTAGRSLGLALPSSFFWPLLKGMGCFCIILSSFLLLRFLEGAQAASTVFGENSRSLSSKKELESTDSLDKRRVGRFTGSSSELGLSKPGCSSSSSTVIIPVLLEVWNKRVPVDSVEAIRRGFRIGEQKSRSRLEAPSKPGCSSCRSS